MRIRGVILLTILIVAGNIACRIGLSYDDLTVTKSDGEYHVFERGIDNVGIIVEDVVPVTVGNASSPRHNTSQGRYHNALHKAFGRYFRNIKAKVFRCCLTSASRPHTLYFIFALHRMRD